MKFQLKTPIFIVNTRVRFIELKNLPDNIDPVNAARLLAHPWCFLKHPELGCIMLAVLHPNKQHVLFLDDVVLDGELMTLDVNKTKLSSNAMGEDISVLLQGDLFGKMKATVKIAMADIDYAGELENPEHTLEGYHLKALEQATKAKKAEAT